MLAHSKFVAECGICGDDDQLVAMENRLGFAAVSHLGTHNFAPVFHDYLFAGDLLNVVLLGKHVHQVTEGTLFSDAGPATVVGQVPHVSDKVLNVAGENHVCVAGGYSLSSASLKASREKASL